MSDVRRDQHGAFRFCCCSEADVTLAVITETGVTTGKHRRVLDSTVLDDAVARQGTGIKPIAGSTFVTRSSSASTV